jgi:hypothetical protein
MKQWQKLFFKGRFRPATSLHKKDFVKAAQVDGPATRCA